MTEHTCRRVLTHTHTHTHTHTEFIKELDFPRCLSMCSSSLPQKFCLGNSDHLVWRTGGRCIFLQVASVFLKDWDPKCLFPATLEFYLTLSLACGLTIEVEKIQVLFLCDFHICQSFRRYCLKSSAKGSSYERVFLFCFAFFPSRNH